MKYLIVPGFVVVSHGRITSHFDLLFFASTTLYFSIAGDLYETFTFTTPLPFGASIKIGSSVSVGATFTLTTRLPSAVGTSAPVSPPSSPPPLVVSPPPLVDSPPPADFFADSHADFTSALSR